MKEKIKKYIKVNTCIFLLFFAVYIFLGLCMSYEKPFTKNIFLGADNYRVFRDLTDIKYSHYRIKVHPLFLIFLQTIILLTNGITNSSTLSVALIESLAGAISVSCLYGILKKLNIDKIISILITIIYGFSFSILTFSTIPESFIFAGTGLIAYWYIVTCLIKSKEEFSKKELLLLIFFGVFSFGITLTNYVSYLIGLVVILLYKYDLKTEWKKIIKYFLLINIFNMFCIIFISLFQKFIWKSSPLFISSIIDALKGKKYEEINYMDWNFNLNKTIIWIKNTIFYPIISAKISIQKDLVANEDVILFENYFPIINILLTVIFSILFIFIIRKIILGFLHKNSENIYTLFILINLLTNMVLHYIYGSNEAFMYSPHFIFLLFILIAMVINELKNKKIKIVSYCLLGIFAIFEVINNLIMYSRMILLSNELENRNLNLYKSISGTVFICGIIIALYIIHNYKKEKLMTIDNNVIIHRFTKCILTYLCTIFIIGVFIAFNF